MAICTIIEAITILKVEARELGKEFLNKNKKLKKTIIITTKYLGFDWQYILCEIIFFKEKILTSSNKKDVSSNSSYSVKYSYPNDISSKASSVFIVSKNDFNFSILFLLYLFITN